jgi:hypothetical protein
MDRLFTKGALYMGSYARGYTKWDFTNYFIKAVIGAVRGSSSKGQQW